MRTNAALRFPGSPWLLALSLTVAATARAQPGSLPDEPTGWHLFGSDELLVERIDVDGDRSASPYFVDGTFVTNRLDLGLGWSDGLGRNLRLRAELVGADNAYLAEDGAVVETLTLGFESGAAAVPYRFQVGDVFGDVSRRTLQRSVRGLSFELQPQTAGGDHSLVLLAATGEPSWRRTLDGDGRNQTFSGLSYLFAPRSGRASLSASVVRSETRPSASSSATPAVSALTQTVGSLAGQVRSRGGLELSGELAYLKDGNDDDDDDDGRERDTSAFIQLARSGSRRFTWKLRVEDNGAAFAPPGAVGILADRRLAEANARWMTRGRGFVTVHLMRIHDRVAGPAPRLETDIAGLGYQGQPVARRPSFRLRLAVDGDRMTARDTTVDRRFRHYAAELGERLGRRWDLRYSGDFWDVQDRRLPAATRRSLDHALTIGLRTVAEREGSGSVGVRIGGIVRRQWIHAGFETTSPVLDLDAEWHGHRIALHLSFLEQDFTRGSASDLRYTTQGLVYSFAAGAHELSLEAGRDLRRPDAGAETDSMRLALRYRLLFDRRWGV
jgi:hypothetical protein